MPPRRARQMRRRTQRRFLAGIRRRRQGYNPIRSRALFQSQLFTETFKCNTVATPGPTVPGVLSDGVIRIQSGTQFTAGKFMVRITDIPQIQNQANLQNMYKILKATFIVIPKFSSAEPNAAQYNQTLPSAAWESCRFVQAVNDTTNDLTAPTSELQVLEDNGVKIRQLTRPLKITFRPKAAVDGTDAAMGTTTVIQPKYRPWLGFGPDDGNLLPSDVPYHVGVNWVLSCDNTSTTEFLDVADVQCKVTFVCKDPR